jgi:TolB-like protein
MDRASNSLRLRLLGRFELCARDGRDATPTNRKTRAVLACLALSPGHLWPREKLMALLWSDRSEEQARASLRQALAELRRALGEPPPLCSGNDAVSLESALLSVDAVEFEHLAKSGQLFEAAALYRGDLLDGHGVRDGAFDDWLLIERRRLHDLAVEVLSRYAGSQAGEAGIETALRLLQIEPEREETQRLLMRLYAAANRRPLALRQYEVCRETLQRELGVEPDAETEALYRQIQNGAKPAISYEVNQTPAARAPSGDKPSIAVLPFVNMSGDPEQEYFVDGLTDDIITALSHVSGLTVIARTSSFIYKGEKVDTKRVAKELSVGYVMEGSVRRAGERVRVSAQLIDGMTGHHVWAERYDRPAGDIFDIQDEIMRSVAATTEIHIHLSERLAIESRASSEPGAGELTMRAWGRFHDFTPEAFVEASELAEQALHLDPTNRRAHIIRARAHLAQMFFGIIPQDEANIGLGLQLAQIGVRLSPRDEWAHFCLAFAYELAGRIKDGVAECKRAIELNPNFSVAYAELGRKYALLGQPEQAIQACQTAVRLSPRDPTNFHFHTTLAMAHFVAGRDEAALEEARTSVQLRSELPEASIMVVAAASALGKVEEAHNAVASCVARWPNLCLGNVIPKYIPRFAREPDNQRLLARLREAGLPE